MAAGDRSKKIYGRIKRVLKSKGFSEDAFNPSEIYDEINEGQKLIFNKVPVETVKTISIISGTKDYSLIDSTSGREIYGAIVRFIRPSTWNYGIDYVYPNEWDSIVNDGEYDTFTNPVKATIFANYLKLYPAPSANATLTIHALLKMPTTDVSTSVDPETPEDFDSALEDYALFGLTQDGDYLALFEKLVEISANAAAYKGYSIQRPRTW